MRIARGATVAALVAAVGAVILGEYQLVGATMVLAPVLFGLVVAEVHASVARDRSTLSAAVAAVIALAGLVWAAWIQSGRDWDYVPGSTWVAACAGAVLAGVWVRSSGTRAARSPDRSQQPPAG